MKLRGGNSVLNNMAKCRCGKYFQKGLEGNHMLCDGCIAKQEGLPYRTSAPPVARRKRR